MQQNNNRQILTGLLSVCTILFLGLAYFVAKYPPSFLDIEVSSVVQRNHNPSMDQFMAFISVFGYVPVSAGMAVITSAIFYLFKYKREATFAVLTLTSGLVSSIIKIVVNRPRPTKELVRIVEIAKHESFPSGHTLFYMIFFGFLIMVMTNKKSIMQPVRIATIIFSGSMILLIPFSRIYLGAHWFTDVTGGILLGIICLIVLGHFYLAPHSGEKDKQIRF